MNWLARHFFADVATAKAVTVSATVHLVGLGMLVAFGPEFETVHKAPRGEIVVSLTLESSESEDLTAEIEFIPPAEQPPVLVTPDRVRVAQRWYRPVSSQVAPPDLQQLEAIEPSVPEEIFQLADNEIDDATAPVETVADSDPDIKPEVETQPTQRASKPATADTAGRGDQPPQFTYQPSPVYPRGARLRHMEGTVLLGLEISADGIVTEVRIVRSSNYELLDGAAVNAVSSWRCVPRHRGGIPVASSETLPVHFRLQ